MLTTRRVLFKHVLKNAMIPIITRVVLAIPFLFLGSLLLERFFGIPGLGYLFKRKAADNEMEDLLIFITPHILKPPKSGS